MALFKKINKQFLSRIIHSQRQNLTTNSYRRLRKVVINIAAVGGVSFSLYWAKNRLFTDPALFSPVLAKEAEERRDERRQAVQTAREMRFLSFASIEYQGNVYMTPIDFLESVTEEMPRPRRGRERLSDDEVQSLLKHTPRRGRGSRHMFRDLEHKGLISYTEYLFLLCVLTKPQSGFQIAFNMFDTDGNQRVDKKEYLVLVDILERTLHGSSIANDIAATNQIPPKAPAHRNLWQQLQDAVALEEILTIQKRSHSPEDTLPLERGAGRQDLCDTTLIRHFFGRKGTDTLQYEDFAKFMDDLQTEVMELEFHEFSRGLTTISEEEFARILLRYTTLSAEENAEYLNRLRERIPDQKGITFQEFKDFGQFLNCIDDFSLAMKMYTYLDQPISEEEFMRATMAVTGRTLSSHLTHVVFQLFDKDGDGHLSQAEFISVMKDRIHRGFKVSQVVSVSAWESYKKCVQQEMKNM